MLNWLVLVAFVIVGGLAMTGPIMNAVTNAAEAVSTDISGAGNPDAKWIIVGE